MVTKERFQNYESTLYPSILILNDNGLNEPLKIMNGFKLIYFLGETLLVGTGKVKKFGFTLELNPIS